MKLEIDLPKDEYAFVYEASCILNVSPSVIVQSLISNAIIKAKCETRAELEAASSYEGGAADEDCN